MTTARDAATYLLESTGPMTAMKLQKLLYYCQAWSLVSRDRPLFDDEVQAWAAGPVVRSLFAHHRGKYVIDHRDIGGDASRVEPEERKMIDKVVAHYGKLSASELSDLTHSERPWREARDGLDPTERGDRPISLATMFDYYSALTRKGT